MGARLRERTPVTLEALAAELRAAWPECEDVDVAILWGKLIAECGWPESGAQSVWCWNIGNIRGSSPAGEWAILRDAWELAPEGKVPAGARVLDPPPRGAYVPPGHVAYLLGESSQRFRAYGSLREAVEDYLDTIRRTFRRAWAVLEADDSDAEAFVLALKADRYFTGDASTYVRNVRYGMRWALDRMPPRSPPPRPEVLADLSSSSPATRLRAGPGERTVRPEEVEL